MVPLSSKSIRSKSNLVLVLGCGVNFSNSADKAKLEAAEAARTGVNAEIPKMAEAIAVQSDKRRDFILFALIYFGV